MTTTEISNDYRTPASTRRTALYRHFDSGGRLLYVGISLNAVIRLAQHAELSDWSKQIARVDIEWFETRVDAMRAERIAVQGEDPAHNRRLRGKSRRAEISYEEHSPGNADADEARTDLRRRIAFFPAYSLTEVARLFGTRPSTIAREIKSGRLGSILFPNNTNTKMNTHVSGWQLIDYIELLEAETASQPQKKGAFPTHASDT